MPSRPSDYPEECIPRTPDDVFYEDEEEKEGGIYEKIIEYGEEHSIEYSDEQIARFKAYVDAYVAYLKALQAFEKAIRWAGGSILRTALRPATSLPAPSVKHIAGGRR